MMYKFVIPFLILLSCLWAQAKNLPDILFLTSTHFGGFGRLTFNEQTKKYELVDGRINTYVVDGQNIRPIRPDEGGGTMGNPGNVVVLNGKIFGPNSYNQIVQFDAVTGQILKKYSYGNFIFAGSGSQAPLFSSNTSIIVANDSSVFTLNDQLEKTSEVKLTQKNSHVRIRQNFLQDGAQLFSLDTDNPNTYTDCVGGCHFDVLIRQTEIDFSNPQKIKIDAKEEKISKNEYFAFKSVDAKNKLWILVTNNFSNINSQKNSIELRYFNNISQSASILGLETGSQILALTENSPFWIAIKDKNKSIKLGKIEIENSKLKIKYEELAWLKSNSSAIQINANSDRLFISAGNKLAIYDITTDQMKLIHQQSFIGLSGNSLFEIEKFKIADLPEVSLTLDKERLKSTLAKNYWDEKDQLIIEAEIDKIQPKDQWAISIFTKLLADRQKSYRGGVVYALRALKKFGNEAKVAIEPAIYATLEGVAIRGDLVLPVKEFVNTIDPTGDEVRKMQKNCVAMAYSCEHVIKQILGK